MENDKTKEKVSRPPKLSGKCGECDQSEKEAGRRFDQCPRCVEAGLIPALFCSQACFKAAWPKHKVFHQSYVEGVEVYDQHASEGKKKRVSDAQLSELATRSEYDALLAEAVPEFNSMQVASAKTLIRKAMKLDPTRGQAYLDLGLCYEISGHHERATGFFLQGAAKWALDIIQSYREKGHRISHIHQWSICIDYASQTLINPAASAHHKPQWLVRDGLLDKVSRFALFVAEETQDRVAKSLDVPTNALDPECVHRLSRLRAMVCVSMVHKGAQRRREPFEITADRSPAQIREAARCVSLQPPTEKGVRNIQWLEQLASEQEQSSDYVQEVTSALSDGVWVVLQGLASKALWNGRVAVLCGERDKKTGRWPVQVDQVEGAKLMQDSNLSPIDFEFDGALALLATIETREEAEAMWDWVRGYAQEM